MRLCTAVVTLLLTACAGQPGGDITVCPEPRPQVCTMEYDPACGVLIKGGRKQYSSPCNACADDAVASYQAGPCTE